MPLFTAMPTSIRKPIRPTMLMGRPLRNTRPMEPIRLSGIHIITMMDSRGESNWMAMTRNTRKMPAAMAVAMLSRPSAVLSSIMPTPKDTPWGRSSWAVRASISFGALYLAESVVVAVRVTLYCPSCRVMVGRVVMYSTVEMSRRATCWPVWVVMG